MPSRDIPRGIVAGLLTLFVSASLIVWLNPSVAPGSFQLASSGEPLLDGFRGRPKADVDALVDAIVAFSGMAAQLGERLVEAEINPVFVRAQGEGVSAADGVVVLA